MASPQQFQSMTASVFPSQGNEIVIAKQSVLSEHGHDVRAIINQLPPEVSRSMLAEYSEPQPQLVAQVEAAVISRELAIEHAAQEINLDQKWLQAAIRPDEDLSAEDDWNIPAP